MQILESAVRSFATRSFHGTTMDDIAEDLLLTRSSLYYYFHDKEEILELCHLVALAAVNEALDRVREAGLPPEKALRRLVKEHVRIMVDKFHGSALALEIDALAGARRERVVAQRDRFEKGVRDLIAAGISAGAFRRVDPKLASFAIFGSINWIARWYRAGGGAPADAVSDAFGDLFLRGLSERRSRSEGKVPT